MALRTAVCQAEARRLGFHWPRLAGPGLANASHSGSEWAARRGRSDSESRYRPQCNLNIDRNAGVTQAFLVEFEVGGPGGGGIPGPGGLLLL